METLRRHALKAVIKIALAAMLILSLVGSVPAMAAGKHQNTRGWAAIETKVAGTFEKFEVAGLEDNFTDQYIFAGTSPKIVERRGMAEFNLRKAKPHDPSSLR